MSVDTVRGGTCVDRILDAKHKSTQEQEIERQASEKAWL